MINCHKGVAAFMLVIGALFTILAVACFMLLIRVSQVHLTFNFTLESQLVLDQ